MTTYLVLLPAVTKTWLSEIMDDSFTAHTVIVKVCDVVVFALERFPSSVFPLAGDLANTFG